ncbi:helix-turn-helix domain-containing protein, partial [Streptomyces albus]
MTQKELADASGVSYSMVRAIERGARMPGDSVLDALAAVLGVDPARLLGNHGNTDSRVHDEIPELSRVIAAYDMPQDGPVRPLHELRAAVEEAVTWRVGAQYLRIARGIPSLLDELARALDGVRDGAERREVAQLLVAAYRAADAVAYKFGYRDLSARLVELMRWAATGAEDPLLDATVAYVRTETFFAAEAHDPGLRALERALDSAPVTPGRAEVAARGTLHMRA